MESVGTKSFRVLKVRAASLRLPFWLLIHVLLSGCVTSTEGERSIPPEWNPALRSSGCENLIGRYQTKGEPYSGNPDISLKPFLYTGEGVLQSLILFGENRKSDDPVRSIEIRKTERGFAIAFEMPDQSFATPDETVGKFKCKDGRLQSTWKASQAGLWGHETRQISFSKASDGYLIADNTIKENVGHLFAVVPIGSVDTYRFYWRFAPLEVK